MERTEIVDIIKAEVGKILNQDPSEVDEEERLLKMGVSSIQAIKIINQIRRALDVDINPVAIFEYKTIREFSEYLWELKQEQQDEA